MRSELGWRLVEGADAEERAFDAAFAVTGLADLIGVAAQSNAGRAGLLRNCLANRGYTRAHDGQGEQPDDKDRSDLWFHYRGTTARVI